MKIKNARSRASFEYWYSILQFADWNNPEDILKTFGTADLLGNGSNRVVFNIGGNNYRMICHYHFGATDVHVYINWIGTHARYNELCHRNQQYKISSY